MNLANELEHHLCSDRLETSIWHVPLTCLMCFVETKSKWPWSWVIEGTTPRFYMFLPRIVFFHTRPNGSDFWLNDLKICKRSAWVWWWPTISFPSVITSFIVTSYIEYPMNHGNSIPHDQSTSDSYPITRWTKRFVWRKRPQVRGFKPYFHDENYIKLRYTAFSDPNPFFSGYIWWNHHV